ncbi:MAG TPA: hypothetical protein VEY89_00075 [Candidatus Dormibacteraeota bacterium]|nr:hypothetical protein [Candidatus Dormibacteraeota bacterium]
MDARTHVRHDHTVERSVKRAARRHASARFDADGDAVMFREREVGRAAGLRRSRTRAAAFAAHIGLDLDALRAHAATTIVVTGSKGEGTAAVYASAVLAAARLRVGTLTSPGLRTNRERIRVDGSAIAPHDYRALIARVESALDAASGALPDNGYLAPTGLFTLAAVRHFLDSGCDAWVLEAGMGGASDEVSLFAPGVLVLTPVFSEHVGILGDTVADIARDKLGAATHETRAVMTLPQPHPEAAASLEAAPAPVHVVNSAPLDDVAWPPALIGANARLGVAAALQLLKPDGTAPDPAALRATLATVTLPGRMSVHVRDGREWRVDTATNGEAVRAALSWSDAATSASDVLLCVPDGKDVAGVRAALSTLPFTSLRTDAPHLSFGSWPTRPPSLQEIDLDALGSRVLALGTVHFIGDVMELLDVDTERSFTPRR